MDAKAQVALEYILIIVVSIVIIISALIWMQAEGSTASVTAENRSDSVLCDIEDCDNDSSCQTNPNCGPTATCGPDRTCIP